MNEQTLIILNTIVNGAIAIITRLIEKNRLRKKGVLKDKVIE